MSALRPIFGYLSRVQDLATGRAGDVPEFKGRSLSFGSYRNLRRKPSLISKYGFFSTLTCEGYVAKAFGLLMDVITGRRLALLLTLLITGWLMVFIRLSFIEVWQHSAVDDYRRDIRRNMHDIDSSLKSYRLIRPLTEERRFHVRMPAESPSPHSSPRFKKKVVIFAYKRGGASVFAEIFNHDPNAMLWYDVLDPFYVSRFGVKPNVDPERVTDNSDDSNRDLVRTERKWLSDYFRQIFFCQTQLMPLELILHNYMLDLKASAGFRECLAGLGIPRLDESAANCSAHVRRVCGPTVERSIRMQCPTILNAGAALRETVIRQMEGDLDVYLADRNITAAFERRFDELLGSVRHTLPPDFGRLFPAFLGHQFCLAGVERTMRPCRPQVADACGGRTLGVVHLVRLKCDDLRFVLRDFPSVHVVFYVRDPRAVAHSRAARSGDGRPRARDRGAVARRTVDEARQLCPRMLADYWEMVKLQNKFPKAAFVIAKYEDMVLYPYEMALEFYNHLGLWLPESYKLYVETHMIVDKAEYLFGSGSPSGGNDTLHHWRDVLNKNEIKDVNRHCRDVLDLFQYSL